MKFILRSVLLIITLIHSVYAAPQFLTISDIHYGSDNVLKDGEDTGTEFLAITLNKFKELSKNVDFILNLGDLPTHMLIVTPKKEEYEKTLFHDLFTANQSLKPMFYITGNNDSLDGNYQPFETNGKSPLNLATDWNGACLYCDGLLIDDSQMRHGGYYASYVMPNNKDIILLALNTVQWTKSPLLLPSYPNQNRDAQAQLSWLEQQLKNHHAKQLLIAMHVPPGTAYNGAVFWHPRYLNAFIALLNKYHHSYGQITLLMGHTHMEELRKIRLQDGTAIYGYSTPGISRIHYNNPGMKVFSLDDNYRIKNFITYYTMELNSWGSLFYHALGTPEAIFPECRSVTLAQCLDHYSEKQVCEHLQEGLFNAVKSARAPNQRCTETYLVN